MTIVSKKTKGNSRVLYRWHKIEQPFNYYSFLTYYLFMIEEEFEALIKKK